MLNWRRWNKSELVQIESPAHALKKPNEFKVDSPHEFAYTQYMQYPATYKPYLLNFKYHGGHFLSMTLIVLFYAIWRYERTYLQRNGLKKRSDRPVYQG